jgi:electron transfer flavoprotein beta subunit
MNIVVCIKQIKQVYARSGRDPESHFLTPMDRIVRINPYDEAALEAALRIKDQVSGTRIILLTLGEVIAEEELRRCLALGADALYQIDMDLFLDAYAKSKQLASVSGQLGADLILCGKESMDCQNGLVGAFMAAQLNMPFVSAIVDVDYIEKEKRVEATRSCGRGVRETVSCLLPAVLSVDMGLYAYRIPGHANLQKAAAMPIQSIAGPVESSEIAVSISHTMPPRPRPKQTPAPDNSLPAIERIQQLLTGSIIEKKGQMLQGDSEELVEGIMDYLGEHGFVES